MAALKIRTTVGDIAPGEARGALTHEHLIWFKDGMPDADKFLKRGSPRIVRDMAALATAGCNLLLDATPAGQLRPGDLYRRIARRTGVRVVASTGAYTEKAIPPRFKRLTNASLARIMVREIEQGIEGEGVRAGVIKIACGKRKLAGMELKMHRAAVLAHRQTGAPITCHSYQGLISEVEFFMAQGVDPAHVALGHVEANGWIEIIKAARCGFMLCCTNFGSDDVIPDGVTAAQIVELVQQGHERQIMLSNDFLHHVRNGRLCVRWPHHRYNHIFLSVVPRLRALGLSKRALDLIVNENPRRFLAF